MKTTRQAFQETLRTQLKNASTFSPHEIAALCTILTTVIGSPTFSLNKVAKRAQLGFSRNFLAKCLMKYAYVQRTLAKQWVIAIISQFPRQTPVLLVVDDTLVKKCGKHIQGAYAWFDHTSGRVKTSLCLVNVALVIDDHLVFVLPWLLQKPHLTRLKGGKTRQEQDAKTLAAIEMIRNLFSQLERGGILGSQIVVVADAWYANKTMQTVIKQTGANFRLDARSNLSVQCPDHQALKIRNKKRRGRKRRKFVCYVPLKVFMGDSTQWQYFTDPTINDRIYYRRAILTLKAAGRVTCYAFHRESMAKPKFILTRAFRIKIATPQRVYREYQSRWRIEEAHRDLKQQFGLSKCQARRAWVVSGFIALVYLGYCVWQTKRWVSSQVEGDSLKCPSWADEFHRRQIFQEVLAWA
jgi:hypothetical protein